MTEFNNTERSQFFDSHSFAILTAQDARKKAIEAIESDWTCPQCRLAGISEKVLQCPSGCIL